MQITLTTLSPVTEQEYRIADATGIEWFLGYGSDGAGYGYLSFILHRRSGYDYPDIGHGYEVRVTKGPWKTLFHGQITKITETSGDTESITVWCLGFIHLLGADTYNWVYCDTRMSSWTADETPSGYFRPDYFEWSTSDGVITIKPRNKIYFDEFGYEYTAIRYSFDFGESLSRIKLTYQISTPADWLAFGGRLRFDIVDSLGTTLLSESREQTASVDYKISSSATWVELRLYMTSAGTNDNPDGDVFVKIAGLKTYSTFVSVLDAAVIAKDLVSFMYRSGKGLNSSTDLIQSPGVPIEPAAFVSDMRVIDILAWCCQFGNSAGIPIAFGVSFDDTRRLFIEPWDITSIRYVVAQDKVTGIERTGDWSESAQTIYGVTNTDDGGVIRTSDMANADVITKLGGYYRREAVALSGISSYAELGYLTQLYLSERAYPQSSGSYNVKRSISTPGGLEVPIDEIVPGGLVQVREWRAREAALDLNDYRDNATTFMLVGVRVNLDAGEAELSPSESSDSFARAMAIINELRLG